MVQNQLYFKATIQNTGYKLYASFMLLNQWYASCWRLIIFALAQILSDLDQ